jgi:hypothetical protein
VCGWVSVCVGDGGVGKEIIVSRLMLDGHVDIVRQETGSATKEMKKWLLYVSL